jgi:hypothetical protein
MKESVEKIIEKIDRKVVRIRSGREMKRAKILLPYHGEREDRRIEDLEHKIKSKIARRRRG